MNRWIRGVHEYGWQPVESMSAPGRQAARSSPGEDGRAFSEGAMNTTTATVVVSADTAAVDRPGATEQMMYGMRELPWVVTVVCGASGVGKTSVAVGLAARFGVPLGEADDIVTALQALTTPEQLPVLHAFDRDPAAFDTAEKIMRQHFAVADALAPGLRAVIADHIEFRAPTVLEGDYLTPELATEFGPAVRAVVIGEPDPRQIVANLRSREPASGDQDDRARVSAMVDAELTRRARAAGVPVEPARPWASGVDRAAAALRTG
jgi:2-phosphoglycerate kinase